MPNNIEPKFHIDSPTAWELDEVGIEIVGWLYSATESGCVDIRARVDDRTFFGIYGLERPDTQSEFKGGIPSLRTGFLQRIQVWHGAKEVALDWHNGTQWREFFRTPLDTSKLNPSNRKPPLVLRAAVVHQSLAYLYRHFHRSSWSELCREAKIVLHDILTPTSDIAIGEHFLGHIENPGYWINSGYGKFRITGWIFGAGRSINQLSATTGVLTENRLIYPKDRPDVAAHRTDHTNALKSGYYGLVDIREDTPNPANLKIFAETGDGTRPLAFARRMYLDRRDEHSGPIPIYRPFLFYKVAAALLHGAILGRFGFDSWRESKGEIKRLQTELAGSLSRGEILKPSQTQIKRRDQDPYTRWCWHNRLTPRLQAVLQSDADKLINSNGPLISILVPAYNTPEKYLRELIACLKSQIYSRWELCIADDASPQSHVRRILEEASKSDARIKPIFRIENGHIARATNSALEVATGEFIALLDHDDLLPHDSLLHVAQAIAQHPTAGYLYTDEDKIDDSGRHFDPQFKGDWNPAMALTHNYTHHLTIIRRAIVEKVGGLRPAFNGAQDIDLFLRCWEHIADSDIIHIPFIGYHWRAHAESTATRGDQKSYLFDAAKLGITEGINHRNLRAKPVLPQLAKDYALCLHQLQWDVDILRENPVTIVIPTKDRVDLLRPCLDSIARTTPIESVKVIIVDDNSTEPEAVIYLQSVTSRKDLRCEVIKANPTPGGFNYSRLVNLGTECTKTPFVLHLNNDVEAISPGWLEDMVGWLTLPNTGVVGAKLLYPDGTINHAGISIGHSDGLPHVLFEREPAEELGILFLPHTARNVAAVTGACLLTRTELYRQLNGFDEEKLQVAYNDVDYCIRAQRAGYRTVYTPQAVLKHIGSATRGHNYAEREHVEYLARHGSYRDPYISESLDFPPRKLPLSPYHQRYAHTKRPFRAIVLTHNLNFEGAPLFIFELARYLAEQDGVKITIASPQDGPLRSRFEELGLKVEIWDASILLDAKTPAAFHAAMGKFAGSRQWVDTDILVCNTMLTFWGVHLAVHLGMSSALYMHESNTVKRFFQPLLPPQMHATIEEALSLATRVIFTAKATRDIHEDLNHNDNFRTLASWVDFDRIEQFMATHDKAALRRKHGLDPDAVLIVNIGSVCERKGQHIYIRGIDLLNKELPSLFPENKIQWVMVGARDGLYMETLMEDIQLMNLHEVRIFKETPEIYDFYRLADILVCTSFEESFPRVLLEAMVFGTRIVSTDVNGIPEMLTNTDEAHLVPAGDPFKLANSLKRALAQHLAGDNKMLSMAQARATRSYHHARALPPHLQMVREAWLG